VSVQAKLCSCLLFPGRARPPGVLSAPHGCSASQETGGTGVSPYPSREQADSWETTGVSWRERNSAAPERSYPGRRTGAGRSCCHLLCGPTTFARCKDGCAGPAGNGTTDRAFSDLTTACDQGKGAALLTLYMRLCGEPDPSSAAQHAVHHLQHIIYIRLRRSRRLRFPLPGGEAVESGAQATAGITTSPEQADSATRPSKRRTRRSVYLSSLRTNRRSFRWAGRVERRDDFESSSSHIILALAVW